jgi:Mg-chelatase subunit ChlD
MLSLAIFSMVFVQQVQAVDIKGNDVEIILDVSGSMAGIIDGGKSKMDVAKEALTTVINEMPENAFVGFRAYGHRSTSANKDCQDSELIYPISKINKSQLISKINSLNPGGWTPIDYSLQQTKSDFNKNPEFGKMVILVSDGEETCGGDPCATVKKMRDEGFDIVVNTVGFDVSGIAEEQLKCVAQATGGEYRSAKNAGELVASMTFFSQRAFEGFANAGGVAAGTGFVNAPTIKEGAYGGDIRAGETKFYKIKAYKGQNIIAALNMKREQAMSEDNATSMCMLPVVKIYDKYQSVVSELVADSCGSGAFSPVTLGLRSGSTEPVSYKAAFIADETGEYYISIGNDWRESCGNYSWCPAYESEKTKKDKTQYDIIIALEGEGAPIEKASTIKANTEAGIGEARSDMQDDSITGEKASVKINDVNIASSAKDTTAGGFSFMVLGVVGVLGIIILIVIILIVIKTLKRKNKTQPIEMPIQQEAVQNSQSIQKNNESTDQNAFGANKGSNSDEIIPVKCANCGTDNIAGAKFCANCGGQL